MFYPDTNSYLQLVCPLEPRLINKAVRRAMRKRLNITYSPLPPEPFETNRPHLFIHCADVTQARLGLGRIGLRIITRQLSSKNNVIKIQALHSILDQVVTTENALYLLDQNVANKLVDLLLDREPIIREKAAGILNRLAGYYQGRKRIVSRPIVVDNLKEMIMLDRIENRYAATLCLNTLSRDRNACEVIMKHETIIQDLVQLIKHDYMEILIVNVDTLKNLSEWDPVKSLKTNAFRVLKKLIKFNEDRLLVACLDCMAQLCKHIIGKKIADNCDMTNILIEILDSTNMEVVTSALGLMTYTTMTKRSKWRAKEFVAELIERLVILSTTQNMPVVQLRAMQVIINLCDCPDIRVEVKKYERVIQGIMITRNEEWHGTSEDTTYGLETGLNYKTMSIEDVEAVKSDFGDKAKVVNNYSYMLKLRQMKKNLIRAYTHKPFEN